MGIETLIIAALMLATSMPVGAVGPESDGSSTESARLSVTALDPLRPDSEARIALRWSGPLPEKISGWLDLDGDGVQSYDEPEVLSATVEEPLAVLRLQLPNSATAGYQARLMLKAASGGAGVALAEAKVDADCKWANEFHVDGVTDKVFSFEVYDDGSGSALYVGGNPLMAAGTTAIDGIGRWDGGAWTSINHGAIIGAVVDMKVFDDGGGPALYVAAGSRVMKWDGTSWGYVGSAFNGNVWALEVYQSELYAGGSFTKAGFYTVDYIAKLGRYGWDRLGTSTAGANHWVLSLEVYDDGSGARLYAAGMFTTIGGVSANSIARWNGGAWSTLGSGLTGGLQTRVWDLQAHDDGSGPALFACGDFGIAGGVLASKVARWNGSSWSGLGSGLAAPYDYPYELEEYDDGTGAKLFIAGEFDEAGGVTAHKIASWNGSTWSALGDGLDGHVQAMGVFDDGSGSVLWVGGDFTTAGSVSARNIATWDGSSWSAIAAGGKGLGVRVDAITVYDEGAGLAVYAAGSFDVNGLTNIAKWNGSDWEALGTGTDGWTLALTVFDDDLYAGGSFENADGVAASRIARWDGYNWSALGVGVDSYVYDLVVYDDGTGPALYVAGSFTTAGGAPASRIARWDGSVWSALGSGLDNTVYALEVFDDGDGRKLYAGGAFTTADGFSASRIAAWDGSSWSPLGSGVNSTVLALEVFEEALIAGGSFTSAGGFSANRIAAWNGSTWSALGSGLNNYAEALAVYEDGSGPVLVAAGAFLQAGGLTSRRIATWDGSAWAPIGEGFDDVVYCLGAYDTGAGPSLWVGGMFDSDFVTPMKSIGRLSCPCDCSRPLAAEQWTMVGLACVPASATVQDVLGDDLDIGSYRSRWVMWDRDEVGDSYRRLTLTDDLWPGNGYWIYSLDATTLDAEGTPVTTRCAGPSRFNQCHDRVLVGAAGGRQNLASHPFRSAIPWAEVIIVDSGNVEHTLAEADAAGLISRVMNKYEYSGGLPPGGYSPYDGDTPGMEGSLEQMDAIWVKAYENATLRIPTAAELSSPKHLLVVGDTAETKRRTRPRQWYVRVIAAGGGMIDRGNVLGEIPGALEGQDRHDLEELPPFGDRYLTVVFPHPWGEHGTFASDYRAPAAKGHSDWRFEVRSDDPKREVTLSFEGSAEIIGRAQLRDELTRRIIPLKAHPTYTFTMGSTTRSFTWRLLGKK